jgi:O-antigen ligase
LATLLVVFHESLLATTADRINRGLRGLATLAVGVGFYFAASHYGATTPRMRRSLRWLYFGGALALLWASVQAYYVLQQLEMPATIREVHRWFSLRDVLETRVTGLAYEPSWLANQLVVLYLPIWIAFVVRGTSAFGSRRGRLSVELGLLIWGLAVLFVSFSRVGLISILVVLAAAALYLAWKASSRWMAALQHRAEPNPPSATPLWLRIAFMILIALGLMATAAAGVVLVSRLDPRVARLFSTDYSQYLAGSHAPVFAIANQLAYAERLIYWVTGFLVFGHNPVLGVGLGNFAFHFAENVPSFGYHLPEIIRILDGSVPFPNTKNLWIRLLAETGIIGLVTFSSWLIVVALAAAGLARKRNKLLAAIGMAGLLAILAQIVEGFSLDTFALPQLWIMLGLVTAGWYLASDESSESGDE